MTGGADWSSLALLVPVLLAAGFVTGFLSGLLGVGGGAVVVIALYEAFRIAGHPDRDHRGAPRRAHRARLQQAPA
jgi:hypothetical protein